MDNGLVEFEAILLKERQKYIKGSMRETKKHIFVLCNGDEIELKNNVVYMVGEHIKFNECFYKIVKKLHLGMVYNVNEYIIKYEVKKEDNDKYSDII